MAPQLQINQGPQDALLFDNTRSYFTNVGYTRTSNFQMELRDVDPQNSANLGGTVNFVIPKAADLLGPCDLMIEMNKVSAAATTTGDLWGWVDSLGYAMIEKITFSVGSHDVEVLTGEHLNIMNELMKSDSQRYGFHNTLKTGRPLAKGELVSGGGTTAFAWTTDGNTDASTVDRLIAIGHTTPGSRIIKDGKKMIIPLGLFFTTHPSKYFPLAAIAGCNDVRISVKFRTLQELLMCKGAPTVASSVITHGTALGEADGSTISFAGSGSAFASKGCFLRCHYFHVTGPEATALMNREHVRLMKLWHGNEIAKQFTIKCTKAGHAQTLDLDLSFLHPVQELIITIRKIADMGSSVTTGIAPGNGAKCANITAFQKNYFAYHGSGRGDPNRDSLANTFEEGQAGAFGAVNGGTYLKTKSFSLKLNGQSRHLDGQGIDRDYLMNRLMPMLHSNTSSLYEQVGETSQIFGMGQAPVDGGTSTVYARNAMMSFGDDWKMLQEMTDRKEIYVYPFALNPEGANPSGSVNFSKVSHAKLSINVEGLLTDLGDTEAGETANLTSASTADEEFQVDVYGVYYNWLAIKDGRALTSFA